MRTYIKLIFAGLMMIAGSGLADGTNQLAPSNRDQEAQKYRIKKALGESVISWLSDGNDLAGVQCDRLADSLLSLPEPGVWSYFIAAQIANLREKPKRAIAILEDTINKYPEQMSPTMHVPVKIVGRFWIGTIARQSGDIAKAKNVYEMILVMLEGPEKIEGLDEKGGVIMICNLYLAEIESLHLKRKDLALTRLEAIERIKKPTGQLGAGYDIYKSWAAYQHTKISRGKIEAAQQLVAYPEILSAHFLAVTQLDLSGIAGDPLIGCAGSDRRIDIVIDTLIARIIKNTASPIDKSLTRLKNGYDQQYKKNFAEAEKHYSALLEDDSFFSPVAGLYLAKVKKAKGDTAQAEATLEKVKTQYPGYKSEVIKVKESWKKGR